MKRTPRAKIIRRALGLAQEEFAARYRIPIGTLRDLGGGPRPTGRGGARLSHGDRPCARDGAQSAGASAHLQDCCLTSASKPEARFETMDIAIRPATDADAQAISARNQHVQAIHAAALALDAWTFNERARDFFRRYGLTPYNEMLWTA